jgi:hypothetical protein
VQAADAVLQANPLGAMELFTDLDPAAAAVAAAHWLQAAADVVGPMAGIDPVEVVIEADNLAALQVETPTLVLRRLNDGATPRQVVVGLVADAMAAAEGQLADPDALVRRLADVHERASKYGADLRSLGQDFRRVGITGLTGRIAARSAHWGPAQGRRGDRAFYQDLIELRNALAHGNQQQLVRLRADGVSDTVSWARARLPGLDRTARVPDRIA